jgi:hypothetical protein
MSLAQLAPFSTFNPLSSPPPASCHAVGEKIYEMTPEWPDRFASKIEKNNNGFAEILRLTPFFGPFGSPLPSFNGFSILAALGYCDTVASAKAGFPCQVLQNRAKRIARARNDFPIMQKFGNSTPPW